MVLSALSMKKKPPVASSSDARYTTSSPSGLFIKGRVVHLSNGFFMLASWCWLNNLTISWYSSLVNGVPAKAIQVCNNAKTIRNSVRCFIILRFFYSRLMLMVLSLCYTGCCAPTNIIKLYIIALLFCSYYTPISVLFSAKSIAYYSM